MILVWLEWILAVVEKWVPKILLLKKTLRTLEWSLIWLDAAVRTKAGVVTSLSLCSCEDVGGRRRKVLSIFAVKR